MELLVYIANCLYLLSYLVQDMLRLRMLTLVAATCLMSYFYLLPEPLLLVVGWNLVFIALNVVQLIRLVAERRRSRQRAVLR
jgi:hypothetical protein